MEPVALNIDSRVAMGEDVLVRKLADEAVLLNLATGRYFSLDPVGARIWELLEAHGRLAEVLSGILEEFDVDEATARNDLLELAGKLRGEGLVRLVPG
jgi:hypothetical protein